MRVWGFGYEVRDSGFRVGGLRSGVSGLGIRVKGEDPGLRFQGVGLDLKVQDVGCIPTFMISGLGLQDPGFEFGASRV